MSRCSCELKNSLDRLSAESSFVFLPSWLFALRYLNTGPFWLLVGPGLHAKNPKCLPPATVHVGLCSVCHKLLIPQREPQLPLTSLRDSPRPVGRSGPGSYGGTTFTLRLSVYGTLGVPSKSGVFIFPGPVELLQSCPTALQSQML